MNIHVISQLYLPEPAGVFTSDLVERWTSQGHEVTVWTATPDSHQFLSGSPRFYLGAPYDRSTLLARTSSQVRFLAHAGLGLARQGRSASPPQAIVVIGSPLIGSLVPILRHLRSSTRLVHWVHDLYPEALSALRPRSKIIATLRQPVKRATDLAFASASTVVAISRGMAERIRARVPLANVQMIPLWAPASVVPRTDNAPHLRHSRGIPEHAFVLMYHGNLGLAYDFEPLLHGAGLLAGEAEFALVIVGAGAQLEFLKSKVSERGLTNVHFFPPVGLDDLSESLAMGDCQVISVRQGWNGVAFPAKFITAVASGRPVILLGPAESEIAEMIRMSASGSVVGDAESLAEAVRVLLRRPDRARAQGQAGLLLYETEFDRAVGLSRWDAVLGLSRT